MICDPGSVVVVPFPFVDQPLSKVRPALVLSSGAFNTREQQTLLAMITTAAVSRWASDTAILDWESAALKSPCVVRLKLFTLENRLILRSVGRLSPRDWASVRAELGQVLPTD